MICADSTVAMSALNLLVIAGAASFAEVVQRARVSQHPDLTDDQARRALDGLVERGFARYDGVTYTAVAAAVVVKRSRRGDGWDDWETARGDRLDAKESRP